MSLRSELAPRTRKANQVIYGAYFSVDHDVKYDKSLCRRLRGTPHIWIEHWMV